MKIDKTTGQVEITGPTTKHKITLSNIGMQMDGDENGTAVMTNLQFTHLFFISLLELVESPTVPDEVKDDINKAFPLLNEILKEVSITTDDAGQNITKCRFTLHNLDKLKLTSVKEGDPDGEETPHPIDEQAAEFIRSVVTGYFESAGVSMALRMAQTILSGIDVENIPIDALNARLFPNSKSMDPKEWGMPKLISDSLSKVIKGANRTTAVNQYTSSSANPRST